MTEPQPTHDDEPLPEDAGAEPDAEAIARGLSALLDEKDKELIEAKDQLLRQRAETAGPGQLRFHTELTRLDLSPDGARAVQIGRAHV